MTVKVPTALQAVVSAQYCLEILLREAVAICEDIDSLRTGNVHRLNRTRLNAFSQIEPLPGDVHVTMRVHLTFKPFGDYSDVTVTVHARSDIATTTQYCLAQRRQELKNLNLVS